ncbi:MAG: hypothetical protein ACOC5B_04070 [Myxococcota bacterium]
MGVSIAVKVEASRLSRGWPRFAPHVGEVVAGEGVTGGRLRLRTDAGAEVEEEVEEALLRG